MAEQPSRDEHIDALEAMAQGRELEVDQDLLAQIEAEAGGPPSGPRDASQPADDPLEAAGASPEHFDFAQCPEPAEGLRVKPWPAPSHPPGCTKRPASGRPARAS